jgi:hypothetical protein
MGVSFVDHDIIVSFPCLPRLPFLPLRFSFLNHSYQLTNPTNRLPRCYSDHTRGNRIRDSVRQFSDRKYKSHWDNLFLSVGNWFRAMGEDLATKRFEEDWARLTRDLGCLKIALGLWNDLRWLSCRRLWIRYVFRILGFFRGWYS